MPAYVNGGPTRMDEYSKEEWWDVMRKLRPDWSEERFEEAWEEFQLAKARMRLQ